MMTRLPDQLVVNIYQLPQDATNTRSSVHASFDSACKELRAWQTGAGGWTEYDYITTMYSCKPTGPMMLVQLHRDNGVTNLLDAVSSAWDAEREET
jgi:hypothetical protein